MIGAEIEAVKTFFAGRGVPWYWWLGPHPCPSDMAGWLEQYGLAFDRAPLSEKMSTEQTLLSPEMYATEEPLTVRFRTHQLYTRPEDAGVYHRYGVV